MSVDLDSPPAARQPFASAPGVTPAAAPGGRSGFLSEVIVELGFAEAGIVEEAVDESRSAGKVAEEILVENGDLTEEQLARAIAERNGLPYVDLATFAVDREIQQLIGVETARRYRAAPIAFDTDGALIVALADPLDALAVSDIGVITKSEVRPAVATDSGIEALLARMLDPEAQADEPAPDAAAWTIARSISTTEPQLEPERIVSFGPPEPATVNDVTPIEAASTALKNRIIDLVAAALDDVAVSEVERLEAELASEREAREQLARESRSRWWRRRRVRE